jgi:P27 family predicted phage terminase small subunit
VLEGYCAAYARAVRAERSLAKGSLTVMTAQGRIPRPEVNIAKQAWAEMRAFAVKLGATPADRTRVKPIEQGPQLVKDPWADVAE